MDKSLFKKIAISWAFITIVIFASFFYIVLVESKITIGTILLALVIISVALYRFFILSYSPEWDFWHLECPKCSFNWRPRKIGHVSTSPYDFFHPDFLTKKLRLPFFIRCPQCHKFSWCRYKIERRELGRERIISSQALLARLIIVAMLIIIIFLLWNYLKTLNEINLLL